MPEVKQNFQAAKDALQKRFDFEPESKRQLYVFRISDQEKATERKLE